MAKAVIPIDATKFKALMRLKPTIEDTAAFFECSHDTIERYARKTFKMSYASFREQNAVHTRFSLVRTALQQAQSGNTAMLIFCLKNLCGWKDRHDIGISSKPAEQLSDDELAAIAAKGKE